MAEQNKKVLEVREFDSNKVIHSIDVSNKNDRQIDKIEDGLNNKLNHEKYYTFLVLNKHHDR